MVRHFTAAVLAATTAFAQGAAAQATTWRFLGNARSVQSVRAGALIDAENGSVLVESIAGVGARVRVRFGAASAAMFSDVHSLATDGAPALGAAKVQQHGDTVIVTTAEGVEVRVARHPVRITARDAARTTLLDESFGAGTFNGRLTHYVRDLPDTRYYALGEQPWGLIRNREIFPFWNTDRPGYHRGETPIYSTFPFYIGIEGGVAHGVLYDDPFKGEMDFADRLPGSIDYEATGGPDGGELRYYVIPGPRVDSVLARFTRLTGRLQLPPLWSLGYQQSRYSYAPDSMVYNVANEFRRRDIPADVLYLDIGYMNGYRVFTWGSGFPHPKALLDSLGRMGFKVVPIVDPGVKVDSAYSIFREGLARHAFLTTPDGRNAVGTVWPGLSMFPDFSKASVREWWGANQAAVVDPGVRGIWNDMNEPASFTGRTLSEIVQFDDDGRPGSMLEYHNQYGTLMARASYEGLRKLRPDRRPLVVTRAGYTGVQRYSAVWTGDNLSTFDHMKMSIPMVLSLGLSGEPFAGPDIGGFMGTASGELYSRWLQAAILFPFYRTHSAIDVPRREPWTHGGEYERANRATIRLRYRLLPVLYTAFDEYVRSGAPVVRPLFWSAQSDTSALENDDEYLVGENILVAPVVDSTAEARSVYLPPGRWYRLGSDSAYDGARRITVSAPDPTRDGGDTTALSGLPLFARAGAVIPMRPVMSYVGQRPVDTLELNVWPGDARAVNSRVYEDAGDGYAYQHGQYRSTAFRVVTTGGTTTTTLSRSGTYSGARAFMFRLHAAASPREVTVDGHRTTARYDSATRTISFVTGSAASRVVVQQ